MHVVSSAAAAALATPQPLPHLLYLLSSFLQVLPVLFAVLHVCDEPLRELLLEQLVVLVVVVRQHIRRFLPDLLGILGEFWGRSSKIQHVCLQVCVV